MPHIAPVVIVLSAATLCGVPSVLARDSSVIPLVQTNLGGQNVPLLEAHQNLLLARARLAEQNYGAAVAALRDAENSLADFEKQDHGPLGQQAEYMRQNIESWISHVGRDASLDQIDDWLKTVERWKGNSKNPLEPPDPW